MHSKMDSCLISVIMPAYNAAKTLMDAVRSVQEQDYQRWELIIINDASTDETQTLGEELSRSDARIRLINLIANGGLSNARNVGCREANGQYICFLDSDDLWRPRKLSLQLQFHKDHTSIPISHTDYYAFDDSRVYKRSWKHFLEAGQKSGILYPQLCYRNTIGVLTVMAERELLLNHGLFDTTLWTLEDQDLWIRIAKSKVNFGYLPAVLALYRVSPTGISKKLGKYKNAYKKFIRKTIHFEGVDPERMWRSYYRHFGTAYGRKRNFHLSKLYFCKSLKLVPTDVTAITTIIYLLYIFLVEKIEFARR